LLTIYYSLYILKVMEEEKIHTHTPKLHSSTYIFFLFIPIVVFAVVLGIYYQRTLPPQFGGVSTSQENDKNTGAFRAEMADKYVVIGDTKIFVEVADSEFERRKGLSGRDALAENSGLLFVFEEKDIRPVFWMKDMKFPIDIIWINDGKIVQIDSSIPPAPQDTPDKMLKLYSPTIPIDYVLEVTSGFCEAKGIEVGMEIDLSRVF